VSYATVADVEHRMGRPLADPERELSAALLGDAETLLRARIPDLDQRAQRDDYRRLVVMVEAAAVVRVLRNPGGYRSETAGDYSYTVDTRAAAGYLTVLDDEWRLLGVSPGAFTITPAVDQSWRPSWCGTDCWCPWSCYR
jgi:hypothetical protein